MAESSASIEDVRKLLFAFSEGYASRDLAAVDDFMKIFAQDDHLEFIAVGGVSPGRGTWRVGRDGVRDLIRSDWEYWGSITVDTENAHISVVDDVAWLSTAATITTDDDTEEFIGDKVEVKGPVHNVSTGDTRTKPLRMTAVLMKQEGEWKFQQIHFSFSIRSLPKSPP
jgi:hypothetical protein